MLVTDDRLLADRDLVAVAGAAVAGGVTSVQLRLKLATAREQVALARALVAALPVPVLPGFVIGASVGSADEAASAGGADYWGIGPWRVTTTKAEAGAALGPEGFGRLVALAGGRPCLAIGAVQPDDAGNVRAAGGSGIAVVSGILGAADAEAAARRYATALEHAAGSG